MYTFGEYSPLTIVANMLILPLVSVAMLLTFISGVAGALLPSLAPIVGWPAHIVLSYMTSATSKLATLPWVHGEIKFSMIALCLSYLVIGTIMLYLWRQTGHTFRHSSEAL